MDVLISKQKGRAKAILRPPRPSNIAYNLNEDMNAWSGNSGNREILSYKKGALPVDLASLLKFSIGRSTGKKNSY